MDQEKFDQHLMDYLFDELDEVTSAAMKRKIDADADCRELVLGLRATLEVAQLPMEEPSDDLEERILAAASLAEEGEPWTRKFLRSVTWAGSHAMRPQLAMAAMLVLVVGSSLLLLRVRSGAVAVTPTKEAPSMGAGPTRDLPLPEQADADPHKLQTKVAIPDASSVPDVAPSGATPTPRAATSGEPLDANDLQAIEEQFDEAMASFNSGDPRTAQKQFAAIKGTKSPRAGAAALFEARAVRAHSGCKAAVPYYNAVRGMGGGMSADATWEQADCHRILGEAAQARSLYLALKDNKSYKARAAKELEGQGETANTGGEASSSRLRNQAQPKDGTAPKGDPQPAAENNDDDAPPQQQNAPPVQQQQRED